MFKSIAAQNSKTLLILGLLIVLTLVCGWMEPRFLSRDSLGAVLKYAGLFGVIALGVSFVILTGGIDLSIGSWVGLCAVLYPVLLKRGLGVAEAALVIAGVSVLAGLLHGLLVTKLNLQAFLVTLCGLFIYRGLARVAGGGREQILPEDQEWLRDALVLGRPLGGLPVPAVFLLMVILAVVAAVFLNLTVTGRRLLATGRNEQAARFCGIGTTRLRILAFVICSLLAGLAGVLFLLEGRSALGSSFGNSYELWAIAGAVLGGCSLRGGECAVAGVVLGSVMVAEVRQAVFFVAGDEWKEFVIGVFILAGVIADEGFTRWMAARRKRL